MATQAIGDTSTWRALGAEGRNTFRVSDTVSHPSALNTEWEKWLPSGCAPARATVISKLALAGLAVEIAIAEAMV